MRHGRTDIPAVARRNLEADPERLRAGPGAVLHEITDLTVDGYLATVGAITIDIDQIEEQVFGGDGGDHSERIYKLKREVLEFRRAVSPLVEPLDRLAAHRHISFGDDIWLLFRDVHDHAVRAAEEIDQFNAMLTDVLQAQLAQVGVRQNAVAMRQNEDMRKISAWAAIGLVPTVLAGVFGMNFDTMPAVHWRYGFFALLGVGLIACVSLYTTFRRNGWL